MCLCVALWPLITSKLAAASDSLFLGLKRDSKARICTPLSTGHWGYSRVGVLKQVRSLLIDSWLAICGAYTPPCSPCLRWEVLKEQRPGTRPFWHCMFSRQSSKRNEIDLQSIFTSSCLLLSLSLTPPHSELQSNCRAGTLCACVTAGAWSLPCSRGESVKYCILWVPSGSSGWQPLRTVAYRAE